MKIPATRSGASRKREQVQIGERQRINELVRLAKLSVRFAGKTDHDIGSEC